MKRLLISGLMIAALAAGISSARATVWEVRIENYDFNPKDLTIAPGDSVHWTNVSNLEHTVTRGENCVWDGDFDSGPILPGADWGYAFDKTDAGTHGYFCQFHCGMGMTGTLTVDLPSPTSENSWGKIKKLYR